jgi:hypothetical protein
LFAELDSPRSPPAKSEVGTLRGVLKIDIAMLTDDNEVREISDEERERLLEDPAILHEARKYEGMFGGGSATGIRA